MIECVGNVSEGRRRDVIDALASECGSSLLDVHADADHHRSVFTLAGPGARDAEHAVRRLARAAAERLDLSGHEGVHPRIGIVDVVPFVALDDTEPALAVDAARAFAAWITDELGVPAFLYGEADPQQRSLPEVRDTAAAGSAHPRLGAVAVGARGVLVAVNCELDRDDLALARQIAAAVRARDGGLPGVRALGFRLASRSRAQVSMNLTDLAAAGVERAVDQVRARARASGAEVAGVELVGLLPRSELSRCSEDFRAWTGLTDDQTIEARLERQRSSDGLGTG